VVKQPEIAEAQDKIRCDLAKACHDGDVHEAELAMAALHPRDVNFFVEGSSPLELAGLSGSLSIVKLLLDAGADPNLPGSIGAPLLAVMSDMVDVNTPDVRPKQVEVIELLLQRGADPFIAEEHFSAGSAFGFATGHHKLTDIVDLIRRYCPDQLDQDKIRYELLLVCYMGDVPKVRAAIAALNPKDLNFVMGSTTPLIEACQDAASIDVVRLLLAEGADPNLQGSYGETPLYVAVSESIESTPANIAELTQILLDAGADPTIKTTGGVNALWAAARNCKEALDLIGERYPAAVMDYWIDLET